ncbi:hypothetical protein [Chitinophaga cymbidii]|uniref:Uncharacterized protein n=1 Tax=Chitinophaga cymbidii TaxID=1096750 RepID=A0A512RMZ3_9BACT|nr:hypothetical protein [Chitinophaga cymbidii]GEP97075.1 hypothetical protein CCY01nite_33350 [Chitinophaga cymbidii]
MEDYIISVNKIEELQTIRDVQALEMILERARRTIIGGAAVVLVRERSGGQPEKFETFTDEEEFRRYRERVLRYL